MVGRNNRAGWEWWCECSAIGGRIFPYRRPAAGMPTSLAEQKDNLKREVFICSLLFEFKPDPKGRLQSHLNYVKETVPQQIQ